MAAVQMQELPCDLCRWDGNKVLGRRSGVLIWNKIDDNSNLEWRGAEPNDVEEWTDELSRKVCLFRYFLFFAFYRDAFHYVIEFGLNG